MGVVLHISHPRNVSRGTRSGGALGNGNELPSFADRLERELSRRGVSGTVWKPALDKGFDYDPILLLVGPEPTPRSQGGRACVEFEPE